MKVNVIKTKVVHIRPNGSERTQFEFKYIINNVEVVQKYKYLGLIFDTFLDNNMIHSTDKLSKQSFGT